MESEFVALASAGQEAEWLRDLLLEVPLAKDNVSKVMIHCDSQATLARAFSEVYNEKSRHIGLRHSFSWIHLILPNFLTVNDACIVSVKIFVCKSAYEKKVHGSVHLTFESQTEPFKVEDQCPNLDSLSSVCLEPTKDPDTEFMFAALGRVIYFLKTREVSDMDMKTCKEFQLLWDRLAKFKFDLTWLEPYVQAALGMRSVLEKAMEVEKLKESVVVLKLETERLTAKLVAAEENLYYERDLLKANGVKEVDFFSEFGCGS
ncbi:uncharacterized protein LOC127129811 [Lathyrus oleraceus]|uniref:uncharacterized protein LOC127129811 n=1 Tax=Pisum sativum TaxID=3888 RepID=UPI0021D32B01|nr:uncharacterized protein LOC127129811 [Pisum sativum]